MTNKESHQLYNGAIEIDFYPDSHRFKLSGQRSYLPSVTSITGIIDKSRALIPWAVNTDIGFIRQYLEEKSGQQFTVEELIPVLEEAQNHHNVKKDEAASIGSQVHEFAENFGQAKINGTEIPDLSSIEDERVLNGINGFLDWYNSNNVKFIEAERLVYSKEHEFVGILDAIVEIDGKLVLLDYKTSKGIYTDMYYQISAYQLAYEEETGKSFDKAMILHFNKETGDFATKEFSKEDYLKNYPIFLSCLNIKLREKELTNY
ncbi:MAG: PD-(D/E)XK nuclease family protein [bacterium]